MNAPSKAPKYPILDTIEVPQKVIESWQVTANLLAEIAGIPAVLIMRVHAREIEVFVASQSAGNVYNHGEKATLDTGLYCEAVMSTQRELLIPNALKDPAWDHNPDINLGMISYMGLPLIWPSGEIFGTICMLDKKENPYSERIRHLMECFRDSIQFSLQVIFNASARRKQAEEELRRVQDEWELRVQERTTELAAANASLLAEIDERKRMEMLVRASEEKYRSLFEGMIDGFVTVAMDGRFLEFNEPYRAMLGYSNAEFAQLTYSDITPEKWHSFEADIVKNQILKRGYSEVYEKEYRRKDGTIFPVELHCVLTRDEHGNPSAIWSIIRDITERKRAEELKQMMLDMLDAAPCSITVHDTDGRFYYANQKASQLHGYDKDEFISHNLRDLVVPEYATKLPERYQVLNEKGELTFETIHYRKNGTTFPLEVFSKKSTWDGRPTFLSIATDITLRKESELALRQSITRAETLAAEAKEATRFKSEFLAKMTHELRTPLSGMLGFSELLFETPLNADQELYAKTIKNSGEHLLSIINDVLDLSSMESGKLAIQSESFALAELVETSVLPIRKSAIAKGLGFRCEIDQGLPDRIVGDERRIRQILLNLLGNAIKFTSSGSVALHVTISSTGEQPALKFSVEDTGPGIAPESLSNLFKLFTQADATIAQKFGGTGLGLAISKQLADAMNGSISVVSTPGKGSTFTLQLPIEVSSSDSQNC